MSTKFKIIVAVLFVLSLIIGAHYAHAGPVYNTTTTICGTCGSTTTSVTDGKTTTVTTIVNTTSLPGSITILNLPKTGDATTIINKQVVTTTTTVTDGATTGNLFTGTNFCTSGLWSGSQITGGGSDLGCSYLTGIGSTAYKNATASFTLSSNGVSVLEQAYGFTQSASISASMYFPNSMSMTITQGVKNLDTGETVTQNRTISGTGNYWAGGFYTVAPDNIIVSPNVNGLDGTSNLTLGYQSSLSLKFVSNPTLNPSYPYSGVDVTNPNLTINYNNVTQTQNIAIVPTSIIHYCWQNTPPTCPGDPLTSMAPPTSKPTQVSSTGQFTTISATSANQIMAMESSNTLANNPTTTAMVLTGDPTATINAAPTAGQPGAPGGTGTPTSVSSSDTTSSNSTSSQPGGNNANTSSTTSTTTNGSPTSTTNQTAQTTSTQSAPTQSSQTEGSQTQTPDQKTVSTNTPTTTPNGTTNVGVDTKANNSIKQLDGQLMTVSQKTIAIQQIKLDGMKSTGANLTSYQNKKIPDGKQLSGVPNPNFFNQPNLNQKAIYENVSLVAYTSKDPLGQKQAAQKEAQDEVNKIQDELNELILIRNGQKR